MVRMVPDKTGRFAERPHYAPEDLDRECERIMAGLLRGRRGAISFPVLTDDLAVLIEQHDSVLDSCTDLSAFGDDVEGVTEFFPDMEPKVSISEKLANDPRRENRLRTTLAHEFCHAHFHRRLWAEKFLTRQLFERTSTENKAICKRDTILNAGVHDWMEWQAGYVSGAILMPATATRRLIADYCEKRGLHGAVVLMSDHGRRIIGITIEAFQVSNDAARVRLRQLGLLASSGQQPSLFG